MRRVGFASAACCSLLLAPFAAAGTGRPPARPAATMYLDAGTVIESSSAYMALTNFGAFAYDLNGTSNWGLRFPEEYGPGVIFASGLWLGANVGGQTRLAIATYDQEYRPGSAFGGTPESPDPAYLHVFKLYRTYAQPSYRDLALEDYDNNALSRGAPVVRVLGDGSLDIPGDEMCWAVCNDLAPAGHQDPAGSTPPLGVEVQQTTWSYLRGGPWASAFLLRFTLLNRGPNTLTDMHVGFWADPDLGGFADDLVASDSTLDLVYCYNATSSDALYDTTPPAVGYCLLQGPAGLPATACVAYTNGSDPISASESFNSMHGLTRAGGVIQDPGGHTRRRAHNSRSSARGRIPRMVGST